MLLLFSLISLKSKWLVLVCSLSHAVDTWNLIAIMMISKDTSGSCFSLVAKEDSEVEVPLLPWL